MPTGRELRWQRVASVAIGVAVAAVCVSLWLALSRPVPRESNDPDAESALGVRDQATAELVSRAGGVWDLAPDPDVGRLLQPSFAARDHHGVAVRSNRFGMREREYALPKPEGVFRVVLLGDSFVYGLGAPEEVRLGAVLERELNARLQGGAERVECLHLALGSWNIRSATSFLRRQLTPLAPDLVIHVTVSNDLDDTTLPRGFGAMAEMSLQRPEQRGVAVQTTWPRLFMDVDRGGYLACGLDWESQHRFESAAADLAQLADAVEAQGGRYVHVGHWIFLNPIVSRLMTAELALERCIWFPADFYRDRDNWVRPDDAHWGELGHRRAATAIYAELSRRGMFASLELEPWPESESALEITDRGAAEAAAEPDIGRLIAGQPILAELERTDLAGPHAGQVHAGVLADGTLLPFASMILARGGGDTVAVEVEGLGRPELEGAELALVVDGEELSRGELPIEGALALEAELGPEFERRPFLTIRLVADDSVYSEAELRRLVCGRLIRAAVR